MENLVHDNKLLEAALPDLSRHQLFELRDLLITERKRLRKKIKQVITRKQTCNIAANPDWFARINRAVLHKNEALKMVDARLSFDAKTEEIIFALDFHVTAKANLPADQYQAICQIIS